MGEGRSYGLCALCDVVLEACELLLGVGEGPGNAGAEALGKRLSALDARCHRLLEGRAEAVGLRSHFSEAVARIVPGVVEVCSHPLGGGSGVPCCVRACRAHVVERPLCVLGLILDVVCRVCGPVKGLNEFPLYGLYWMGEGRSYGLCALCDVVLEACELLLGVGEGPGNAGAEALGKRLSALDARCHRLLEGRAEAVGLRSHFSEAVARIVPGVVEVCSHPLGGGSGVPCCVRACRAHVADCAAARLCPSLCPVYSLINVAEAAFHLFDGVQGVRRLEAYAIGEVSCVCQVFTSLNAEIAAPEGTAISFCWGSIRLATASGPRRLPGTLSSPFL